jgi:hypothetical protein
MTPASAAALHLRGSGGPRAARLAVAAARARAVERVVDPHLPGPDVRGVSHPFGASHPTATHHARSMLPRLRHVRPGRRTSQRPATMVLVV